MCTARPPWAQTLGGCRPHTPGTPQSPARHTDSPSLSSWKPRFTQVTWCSERLRVQVVEAACEPVFAWCARVFLHYKSGQDRPAPALTLRDTFYTYRLGASFLKWVFQERAFLVNDSSAKNITESSGECGPVITHGAAEAGLGGLWPSGPRHLR